MERGRVISRVVGELGSSINGEGSAQQVLDSSGRFAKIRNLALQTTSTRQVMIVSDYWIENVRGYVITQPPRWRIGYVL